MTEIRIRPRWPAALVALVALLLYARTVKFGYVWDDLTYLEGFSQYRGLAGAIKSFTEPFYLYSSYYRPLAVLGFVVSGEPSVQHGINVVLHALNTALVFYVARALMPEDAAQSRAGTLAAVLGALIFAVHPVAVESTAWVSGRFDTLMCGFVLGTSLIALGGDLTRNRLALVFVLFACAMGSKESAIGLPLALPFLLLLKWRLAGMETPQIKTQVDAFVRLLAALAFAFVLYIVVRLAVVHTLTADKTAAATFSGGSVMDKLNVASLAISAFARLIVAPLTYSAPLHPFMYEAGRGLLANTLVVVLCVLILLALVFVKKPRLNFPLAFLAALAMSWPTLHIIGIPNGENIVSERYALVPLSLLLAALAAVASVWAARWMSKFVGVGRHIPLYAGTACLLWAGSLAAYSHATIPLWRDEIVFWEFAHRQAPESAYAHKNYIRTLMVKSRWAEANSELNKLWEAHPEHFEVMTILDVTQWMQVRSRVGDYDGAVELSRMVEMSGSEALKTLHPRELGIFYGTRGLIEMREEHWPLAESYLEKAVRTSPEDVRMAFLYAQTLYMTGQSGRSDEVFERALVQANGDMAIKEKQKREIWRRQAPARRAPDVQKDITHD